MCYSSATAGGREQGEKSIEHSGRTIKNEKP